MSRKLRRILTVAVAVFVVGLGVLARFFVWPPESLPVEGDAIVVFAGGRGERIEWALTLAESGLAPVVVISRGVTKESLVQQALDTCASDHPFEVQCVVAELDSTRGEAAMFGTLAAQEGWRDLIAVTSDYHLVRAAMLLERCHHGTVYQSAARRRHSLLSLPRLVVHEVGGITEALTLERDCLQSLNSAP